ncbi:helix-turn-helix domain-containing protein, partial [Roseomonas sp. ACRSG]|nr:helix-turn-helix domain-containing protein [Roseomonas sp. ACRSG]
TIERALARSNGSLAAAARLLGISRPTIYGLLETHRLSPNQSDSSDETLQGDEQNSGASSNETS